MGKHIKLIIYYIERFFVVQLRTGWVLKVQKRLSFILISPFVRALWSGPWILGRWDDPQGNPFFPWDDIFFDGSLKVYFLSAWDSTNGYYHILYPWLIKGSKPERGEDRSIVGGRKSAVLEFVKRFETVKYFLRTLADAFKFPIVSTYLKSPKRRVLKSLPKPNEAQKVALARSRHPNVLKVPLRMTICFRDSLLPSETHP